MNKKVYKVVHIERNNHKVSAFCNKDKARAKTRYPKGVAVTAKIGKLFAFSRLKDANYFRTSIASHPSEVWVAEATDVVRPKFPYFINDSERIELSNFLELFWSGEFKEAHKVVCDRLDAFAYTIPPVGTVICSTIKLLRRV